MSSSDAARWPTTGDEPARIRGTAVVPSRAFVVDRFGERAWERLLDEVSPSAREALREPLILAQWYPFAAVHEMVEGLVRLDGGRVAVLRELAFANLDYSTNLVFRAVFRIGSPGFMVARSDQVWRRYYSKGRMHAQVHGDSARVQLFDFPELTRLYGYVVLHAIEAVIVKAGGTVTRAVQTRSGGREEPASAGGESNEGFSEFDLRWR